VICSLTAALPAAAQSWRTVTSARQVHGERDLSVDVRYGAGHFQLTPGTPDELYRMELRYDEDKFTPVREYDADAGTLSLGVRSREGDGLHVSLGDHHGDGPMPALALSLSPDVPMALNLKLGAVQADVELGGLSLSRIHYETGASETHLHFSHPNTTACTELSLQAGAAEFDARELANSNCARIHFQGGIGETTLDFGGTWRRSMTAQVEVGLGTLNLKLPRDVGVSVHLNRFLASFDAAGFEKRGDMYYSSNYNTARYHLTMDINASFGGIDVAWMNP
jgi:hypothetical protein